MFLFCFIGRRSQLSRSARLICSSRRSLISIPPHSANQLTKKLPCFSWLPLSPICSRAISPLNGRLSRVTPPQPPPTHSPKKILLHCLHSAVRIPQVSRCCPLISGMVDWWMGSDGEGGVCCRSSGTRDLFFGVFFFLGRRRSVYTGGVLPGGRCCSGPPGRHLVNSATPLSEYANKFKWPLGRLAQ